MNLATILLLIILLLSGCASTLQAPDMLNTATLGCGTVAFGPGSVRAAWVKDMQNCTAHIDANGCAIDCGVKPVDAPKQ